jgi:hypothetical protein
MLEAKTTFKTVLAMVKRPASEPVVHTLTRLSMGPCNNRGWVRKNDVDLTEGKEFLSQCENLCQSLNTQG